MKITFFVSDAQREHELTKALAIGMRHHDDQLIICPPVKEPCELDTDIVAFVGMKRGAWARWCAENGKRWMYFDKGYYHREFEDRKNIILWRVSVDQHQPWEYIAQAKHPSDRWEWIGREVAPWRQRGEHIILAGQSEKYHQFFGLPHPTEWALQVIEELECHTNRPIWYRPKPTWKDAQRIEGTRWCRSEPLGQLMPGAHAVITHGSYISVDALLAGVPGIILGPAVTRCISSTDLAEIEAPRLAAEAERLQMLYNLAYCQYRLEEWRSGHAWSQVKRLFL